MAADRLLCWKCGSPFGDIPLPLARATQCKSCHAALHCCRQCDFYDTSVANSCREPIAEKVQDKTRSNFCGYFRPGVDAYIAPDTQPAARARSELDALFGLDPGDGSAPAALSPEDAARAKLNKLFGLKTEK